MSSAPEQRLGWRWALLLVFLLALPCLLGSASAMLALVAALSFVPSLRYKHAWRAIGREPALVIFIAVNIVLLIAFAITAREPADIRYVGNFVPLLFGLPVYAAGRHRASSGTLTDIAIACLAGAALAAFVGVCDVTIAGLPRAAGWFGGPNLMARIALVLGFVATVGLFGPSSRLRLLFWLGPLFGGLAAVLADSRGAILGGAGMAVTLALFVWSGWRHRSVAGLILVLIGAGALGALVLLGGSGGASRLAGLSQTLVDIAQGNRAGLDGPALLRLDMISAGISAFAEAPLFGHGWANFAAAAAPYFDVNRISPDGARYFMFHNDALNFAVAAGLIGLLCWFALLAAPLVSTLRGPRDALFVPRLYVLTLLSVGYAIFGMTDLTLGYDLPTILYGMLTAVVLGWFRPLRVEPVANGEPE